MYHDKIKLEREMEENPNIFQPKENIDNSFSEEYKIEKLIGKGSYGEVFEGIHVPSNTKIAIKKIKKLFEDLIDCKRNLREIILLRYLRHPNIVALYDIVPPKNIEKFDELYLIMEFCPSDLKKLTKSSIQLESIQIKAIIYSILLAIKYMHSAEVLHRDIKPANILVNEDCSAKLCDFGLARSIAGIESSFKKLSLEIKPIKSKSNNIQIQAKLLNNASSRKLSEVTKQKEVSKFLKKTHHERRNLKRELTGHIGTRWYRAPEIILLEKEYGDAVDIWALGCILAELFSMMKENCPTFFDRKPLFPGESCFPLSPNHKAQLTKQGFPKSNTDQLSVIFDIIGTPSEDETSFVTDQKALEYLKTFTSRKKKDLSKKYPGAELTGIDLLMRMLNFNPFLRPSVNECLEHPFFDEVRDKSNEINSNTSPQLDFDNEKELSEEELRKLFLKEVNYYKEHKYQFI